MKGKKVLVFGMARSGIAAARLLLLRGAEVYICAAKREADFEGALDDLKAAGTVLCLGEQHPENLLDGLDGLLGGCSLFDFATMALICVAMAAANPAEADNLLNVAILAGAMVGGLLGFLRYNSHPARVFMGDVGSFFIGGALVGMTLVTRLSLLLPVIALAMVASSLSDIIQIGYFKLTHGKRIFRMAPLHHHFELSGMPETRIVAMYYIVTAMLCLVSLLGFVA